MKTKLFIAAGITNILGAGGALLTNNQVIQLYPEVFSRFGMIAIMLWGLAYIAVSMEYENVRWLIFVFFIEKVAYVVTWSRLS